MVERRIGTKRITLVRGDITDQEVDAFVYDITADCRLGSGYGTAIRHRAGKRVQEALTLIGSCPVGEAVLTPAGLLKARFIIHANGPKFHEPDTENKLRQATLAALRLADQERLERIALPPMGTGLYQVPLALCARVMVATAAAYLREATSLQEIVFVALDEREHRPFAAEISGGDPT